MLRLRRLVFVVLAMLMSVAIAAGGAGYSPVQPATRRSAGQGRRDRGARRGMGQPGGLRLDLARRGYAHTVVLSDSYIGHRDEMRRACGDPIPGVTVICFTPDPYTTRGEAIFTSDSPPSTTGRT